MSSVAAAIRAPLIVAFLAPIGLHASQARADDAPSSEDRVAFESGLSEFRRGNYAGAIASWETLLATMGEERGYKILYNLALAYQAVGDVSKAIEHYAAFESQVAARQHGPADLLARAADAQSRRKQLEQSYGAIHVLAPRHGGAVLTRIGSSEPRAAGYVAWLSPGPHDVELFVGTDQARTITVNVERGATQDIDATPVVPPAVEPPAAPPAAPQPAPVQPAPPQADRPSSTWLWIGAEATVLSVAVPVGFYVVAHAKRDEAESLGPGNTAYAGAQRTYDDWRTAYYVSYAVPVTLAAATVVYALWPRLPPRAIAASLREVTLTVPF